MSDDTPTQRFDAADGDVPTQRMDAADTEPSEGEGDRRSKRLLIILSSVGGALLIALVILLVILLTRGDGNAPTAGIDPTPTSTVESPTPSATPSESPSPTPTETEEAPPSPPEPTGPQITSFAGTKEILCNTQAPNPPEYVLSFSWASSKVDAVFFGVATNDASTGALFENLPPSGNSADNFPYPISFPCPSASQQYTLTVVGNGEKVHSTITVVNKGDTQ